MGGSKVTQSPFAPKKSTPPGGPASKGPPRSPASKAPIPKKSVAKAAPPIKKSKGPMGIVMLVLDIIVLGATITFALLTYMEISIFK
jgi:hypothetical protein